jgi:hypothetical protein
MSVLHTVTWHDFLQLPDSILRDSGEHNWSMALHAHQPRNTYPSVVPTCPIALQLETPTFCHMCQVPFSEVQILLSGGFVYGPEQLKHGRGFRCLFLGRSTSPETTSGAGLSISGSVVTKPQRS